MVLRKILAGLAILLTVAGAAGRAGAADASALGLRDGTPATLRGIVESGGTGLAGYEVSL